MIELVVFAIFVIVFSALFILVLYVLAKMCLMMVEGDDEI